MSRLLLAGAHRGKVTETEQIPSRPPHRPLARRDPLVLSIIEAAELLGISDDLVYELTAKGDLPCLHLGRRKVIPRRAIDLLLERAVAGFDPNVVVSAVRDRSASETATNPALGIRHLA